MKFWNLLPRKIRFFIWNIKTLKKYETKTGKYYLPFFAFQDAIRNRIINNEITDKLVFDKIKDFIKPNSIVLDLGANFGQMSILWSEQKPNVKVYAFEASKYVFSILKKNIDINQSNVEPINALMGNESNKNQFIKKSVLRENKSYGNNKIIKAEDLDDQEKDKIIALKIDDLNFNKKISAMKIDVQGYDLEVLKGSEKTILKHKMPIVFEYEEKFAKEFNYTFKDFEDFIKKINYKIETKIDAINYLIIPK
tara:strand:+ start:333 stop:1088 length:756 start_codon:yes stop_codon:yes gene_type:complete